MSMCVSVDVVAIIGTRAALLQRDALVDLHNATNGEYWSERTSWLIGDPCMQAWFGVTCDVGNTVMYVRADVSLLSKSRMKMCLYCVCVSFFFAALGFSWGNCERIAHS